MTWGWDPSAGSKASASSSGCLMTVLTMAASALAAAALWLL